MSSARSIPAQSSTQDKIIGLFVLIAVALLIYVLLQQFYFTTDKRNWLSVRSVVSNSHGLTKGTLIELSGVTIGNVESVRLRADATVEVIALLDHAYQSLLFSDSKLKINSQLGLDAVLSGVGLELVPGHSGQPLMNAATIEIIEPKSLSQMMDEMQLQDLADRVQSIVANLEKVTSNIADRQQDMTDAMINLGVFSGELVVISKQIPGLLGNLNGTSVQLQKSLENIDGNFTAALAPAIDLMQNSSKVMTGVEGTLKAVKPVLRDLPELVSTANQTAQSMEQLTRSLNNHWLIGGEERVAIQGADYVELMPDAELYQSAD
ncbi:MAG: MCE family protein [Ketobacter sp.]|nr:MAG: MCE family protein [Ketobacter sp.]